MIEINGLCKSFGDHEVLKGIDQNVEEGEVLCIVGPSGSGKSTMLRCINRLEEPTGGEIYIDGELVTDKNVDAMRTKMGMVFQSFNLFPHKSVLENLTIGPVNVKKADKKKSVEKGLALLERVGLAEKANEYPRNLSGGQQQRVAIARALAMDPEVML
ncbi:MAG: amino acid ABC transporter ATP-binding protein, partial [Mogibacterium sp.]|nr:amino acid ABC transporter ATP-binding protein [Mogibacterium sp.]